MDAIICGNYLNYLVQLRFCSTDKIPLFSKIELLYTYSCWYLYSVWCRLEPFEIAAAYKELSQFVVILVLRPYIIRGLCISLSSLEDNCGWNESVLTIMLICENWWLGVFLYKKNWEYSATILDKYWTRHITYGASLVVSEAESVSTIWHSQTRDRFPLSAPGIIRVLI